MIILYTTEARCYAAFPITPVGFHSRRRRGGPLFEASFAYTIHVQAKGRWKAGKLAIAVHCSMSPLVTVAIAKGVSCCTRTEGLLTID